MKKTTYTLNSLMVFVIAGLFLSCTKPKEVVRSSAQNIYPLSNYAFEGDEWFLANDELGACIPDRDYTFKPLSKSHRNAYDFKNKHFSNNLVDTFSPFWQGSEKRFAFDSRLFQLDETHFLLVNTFYRDGFGSYEFYTKVYLTDSHLKNKVLITDRDSSFHVNNASILPDKSIILLESKYSNNRKQISCFKSDNKINWIKNLNTGFFGATYNKDLALTNNTINVLQERYVNSLSTGFEVVVFSYDFSGNLIQFKKVINRDLNYSFNYLNAVENGLIITGSKYNELSRVNDLVLLKLDANLNTVVEKPIALVDVAPDFSFTKNAYGNDFDFSTTLPKPVQFANSIWMPLAYYSKQAGSSLKLIRMNQSLEIESVKPIISNIPENISSAAIKANDSYLFIGGANYKGAFFYRMDKMGNFK
jgi:hypothetical protein